MFRDFTLKFAQDFDKSAEFFWNRQGKLDIEIEDGWYGDSEQGFGAMLSIELSHAEAKKLYDWLGQQITSKD